MQRAPFPWHTFLLPIAMAASASASIVGFWRFEEAEGAVTADASGNGNVGNLSGGFARSGDTPLIDRGNSFSLELDGTGAVSIPDSASLRPKASLTLEAWIQPGADTGTILRKKVG